jgi:hypothetical protein
MFDEAEKIFLKYKGHPHLGKVTKVTSAEMEAMHGEHFVVFQRAREREDPEGKFLNDFAARVFSEVAPSPVTEPVDQLLYS